jgi:general secretion pathway protein A
MYLAAFGLREAPFSTTPDQRFLFLSDRHRDALAHLLYGVAERGGFVQLTGEVGTGKTTVSRYVLEHLPAEVDVALVLNPALTRLELLATICDELGIAYPAESTSVKALVDALYAHLLDAHARGRRTVVIVDEAQHLDAETLEQLRLLTNLETGKAKLLQIILIGQPELLDLMSRHDLRQVAQRVAARYDLTPLTERETRDYVAHRLATAGQPMMLFDSAAIRAVYRASSGIPRLINVVCDRALLGAYATHSSQVTGPIARRAAREVAGEVPGARARRRRWVAVTAAAAAVVLAAGVAWLVRGSPLGPTRMLATGQHPAPVAAAVAVPPTSVPRPGASLEALLADASATGEASGAYAAVAAQWGRRLERRPGDRGPCEAVRRRGLDCVARRGTWNVVRKFDLPVVLEFASPAGPRYLAVVAIDDGRARVQLPSRTESIPIDQIERAWDGSFVLLWPPPHPRMEPIGRNASGADIAWLRQRFAALDGRPARADSVSRAFDEALAARVAAFQRAHGLEADGIAGEETLAKLSALLDPSAPSLRSAKPRR